MIAHSVFFSLKDKSPETIEEMRADCGAFVREIPGIVFFSVGVLLDDMRRPVNDRDFDVHLLVVLQDRASLDVYATAPSHLGFIEKHKANWATIRVFDSDVTGTE